MNKGKLRESGLLKLIVPKEYGGIGESWQTTLKILNEPRQSRFTHETNTSMVIRSVRYDIYCILQ